MLKKTRSGEPGRVKVTFVLPPQPNASHVHLAGNFNDWQSSNPMKRQKDGSWRATLELDAGREYQFRYLVDGNYWVNDEAADAYVPNPFGADNCVVRLESAPAAESGATSTRSRGSGAKRPGSRASGSGGSGGSAKSAGGRSGETTSSGSAKNTGTRRSSGGKGAGGSTRGGGRAAADGKPDSRTTGMAAKGRGGDGSSRGGGRSRGDDSGTNGA